MPKDFWDEHNIGHRLVLIVVIISYILIVIASFYCHKVDEQIVILVGGVLVFTYATLTNSLEGLKNLIEALIKLIKGDRK